MTNHERLAEQYEDALFALLMEGVAEVNGQAALELNQALQQDPGAEVPAAVRDRCEKTVRAAFVKRQLRATGRWSARWLTRVAVAAAVSGLMFTGAFAVSEQVRVATLNTLIQVMDDRTEITFQDVRAEPENSCTETESGLVYHYNIALEWLPEGFELDHGRVNSNGDRVSYISPLDGEIFVSITPCGPGLVYNLNAEDCQKKDVVIRDHPAELYITNEEMIARRFHDIGLLNIWSDMMIYWIDSEQQVIVQVDAMNLTEEEMIRLAEGVHWR